MRRRARVDANQAAVVAILRGLGYRVLSLAPMGKGVPDLLVGTPRGALALLELKDGQKPASERKLTEQEAEFHKAWARHPVFVVTSAQDALDKLKEL